jgi:hypothetical protein
MDGDKYPKSFVEPIDMFVGCGRVTDNPETVVLKTRTGDLSLASQKSRVEDQ